MDFRLNPQKPRWAWQYSACFIIEIARYDPDAVPLEKKVSLKKYPAISSFVQAIRIANMETIFNRAMI